MIRTKVAAARKINVLSGRYGFAQLYNWNETLKPDVLTIPGVVFTDILEDQNRLRVGVERPEVAGAVRQRLASRGIPAGAVIVELVKPFSQAATLRSKMRPLTGGLQIAFGNYVCTLGFLAVRSGVVGMVTNSHCTSIQGGVQNTIIHQPTVSGTSNRIG